MLKKNKKGWESAKDQAKNQVQKNVKNSIPDYPFIYDETEEGANVGYDYQTETTEEAKISEVKNPKLRTLIDRVKGGENG